MDEWQPVEVHAKKPGDQVQWQENGREHGQGAHDVVGAVAQGREVHLHRGLSAVLQPAHVAQHAFHVLQHVARTHAQQFALSAGVLVGFFGPLVQRVDPLLHSAALVLADVFEHVERVARVQQHRPVVKAAAWIEQLLLQIAQLARQQAAQVQVAVDHVVEHAQHQVRRAAGHARGSARFSRRGLRRQTLGEVLAHRTVGWVHRDQDAVKHRKAHRAGVDGLQGLARRGQRAAGLVDKEVGTARTGRQTPKHHQVVPRRVIKMAGQLVVEQVGHMQVHQLPAHQTLQVVLQVQRRQLKFAPGAAGPQEAFGRQLFGQCVELGEQLAVDVEDAHQPRRSSAAASSAK